MSLFENNSPPQVNLVSSGDEILDAVLVSIGIEQYRKPNLLKIAQALNLLSLGLGLAQGRQEHASQDSNNRNHD